VTHLYSVSLNVVRLVL